MKPIKAQNQVALGPGRGLQLALAGMSYRMFRSLITVTILALAVAFLVHMLAYGLVAQSIQTSAYDELRETRQLGQVITRLNAADSLPVIMEEMAAEGTPRLSEYRAWADVPEERFEQARRIARRLQQVGQELASYPAPTRAALMGDLDAQGLFVRIADPAQFENFAERLDSLNLPPLTGDLETFHTLIFEDRPVLVEVAEQVRAGHREAIDATRQRYAGQEIGQLLVDPPSDFAQTLQEVGFVFQPEMLDDLAVFARRARDLREMSSAVTRQAVRGAIAARLDLQATQVSFEKTVQWIDDLSRAEWFSRTIREAGAPEHLTGERVLELAESWQRQRRLEAVVGSESPRETGGFFGLTSRTQWLIGLSFLVCVVGVANAMLMAVTERFTEIATMKCLGAMDGFVMMMFVFEAAIQGVVGGVIGVLVGILLALFRGALEFGFLMGEAGGAIGNIIIAAVGSLGVGIALATVAAILPSWAAARLAPMEAMRVE